MASGYQVDKSITAVKLGIVGGGQLGRMLIQSAVNFDLSISVLDRDEYSPCRSLAENFVAGPLTDFDTLYRFAKKLDVVTIEIENVNVEALARLEKEGVIVRPQPRVIEIIRDKGRQKGFLREHGIPTTDFEIVEGKGHLRRLENFLPAVQKLRTAGYDGRGVRKIRSPQDIDEAFEEPSVLERWVEFQCEISVIVARNSSGDTRTYPAVEMIFEPEANLVEYLVAPARVSEKIQKAADEIAVKTARALGIVGIAAVEMFVMPGGEILVNEIAPRPHNSGHHTIEANVTSQYEQHLRAILDLPLGSTRGTSPAAMVNILGAEGRTGPVRYEGIDRIMALEGAHLHLYGKQETKPFRKMGHVTILDADVEAALQKAVFVKNHLKAFA